MLTLTVLMAAASVLVLILAFWRDLANADRTDRRKWHRTISFGVILLVLNTGMEAGKRVYENHRQKESAEQESTNQRVISQLRDDVHSLKDEAAEAFKRLEAKLTSLPKATAEALSQQAREVRSAVQSLPQVTARSIDEATLESIGKRSTLHELPCAI
jgi:predicted negative regulator of RcsB-dependent stress response